MDRHRIRILMAGLCIGCAAGSGPALENTEGTSPMNAKAERVVHRAVGADRWFPGNARELQSMVNRFLNEAPAATNVQGRIVAAIAPHAGYVYSGKVAGYTFRAIRDNAAAGHKPDVVVVLGFSHRRGFDGVALLDADAVSTPLGEVDIDRAAAGVMTSASPAIVMDADPHRGEHSAENEIPFVQTALPGVKIVVGLMGDHAETTVNAMVNALVKLGAERKVLLIASTDLLHDPDYDTVTRTDKATLDRIVALDIRGLAKSWTSARQVCCGIMPVLTAMRFAGSQGCKTGNLLVYRNSGDDHPDSRGTWVVGYGAVVFVAPVSANGSSKRE